MQSGEEGRVRTRGVGTIKGTGYNTARIESSITARRRDLVHAPMVSVMLRSSLNNSVIVHGPGIPSAVFPLEGKATLLQVLSKAGVNANSDLENAYLERAGRRIASDFQALFQYGHTGLDMEILGGDRLYIPLHHGRLVFVEGAVNTPRSISFYEGMTVLEAIHQAGGFTKFASRNKTTVLRKTLQGKEEIRVRLDDLTDKGDFAQNILLRGGDIIVVKKGWF